MGSDSVKRIIVHQGPGYLVATSRVLLVPPPTLRAVPTMHRGGYYLGSKRHLPTTFTAPEEFSRWAWPGIDRLDVTRRTQIRQRSAPWPEIEVRRASGPGGVELVSRPISGFWEVVDWSHYLLSLTDSSSQPSLTKG